MKLIGSPHSPYVRKVRVVLAEKKLDYTFVEEDVWSHEREASAVNPLGKMPCLIVQEGMPAFYDSRVIVDYLDTLSPVGKLLPNTGRERAEVKTLEALADGIADAAILAQLETQWRGCSENRLPMAKVEAGLLALSEALGDQPYFRGIHLGLADLAVGCMLGWLDTRFPQLDWKSNHARLADLQARLEQRPSFMATRPGGEPGRAV